MSHPDEAPTAASGPLREVPIAWEALEDAFENNAPEVHSYLHTHNGEVIRIVDGIADPEMHRRVMTDALYLRVEPVSSREQYRWMERFIATVEEGELRDRLVQSIDGKGAFRRFKDVLMNFPVDRERWFAFRSERLRSCMESWLETHRMIAVPRKEWRVPTADEVQPAEGTSEADKPRGKNRAALADAQRKRLGELCEQLPTRELDAAIAFLEFLRDRKHMPRLRLREDGLREDGLRDEGESEGESHEPSESHHADGPLVPGGEPS
jgi:hypothetical protein